MSESGDDRPPADAEGLDRPSENEDGIDDLNDQMQDPENPADDSDDDSLLSEVDEAQFADFDAAAVNIAPDLDTLNKTLKVTKRKRAEGEEAAPRKKKERTREKARKNPRGRLDSDEGFSGGEQLEGKRRRNKGTTDGEKKPRPVRQEINDEDLTPEERRRRALDRAMDAAVKKSSGKRAKKGGDIVSVFCRHVSRLLTSSGSGTICRPGD
jgi:transcription factor SPN1